MARTRIVLKDHDRFKDPAHLTAAVNHRVRIRDETRHTSYARALWPDESLQLFAEVARGGQRREWWEGFLAS